MNTNRPLDINGQSIFLGEWYWAENHLGLLVGAGKFAATISKPDDITFFINGTGYNPESFSRFVRCTAVPQKLPARLEEHVWDWLKSNEQQPDKVRWGLFPLGMVQRWIERAEKSEHQGNTENAN